MASIQPDTHSFIVKVWVERVAGEGADSWRGRITHVPSGQTRSFTDLGEIPAFVTPYLEHAGVPVSRLGKLRRWWHGWGWRIK